MTDMRATRETYGHWRDRHPLWTFWSDRIAIASVLLLGFELITGWHL